LNDRASSTNSILSRIPNYTKPRSGERIQPTAQAAGSCIVKERSPEGRKKVTKEAPLRTLGEIVVEKC
jgi:hypothetical protein